jgi:predicted  nucleic acid-binding Zn-ribbon protein
MPNDSLTRPLSPLVIFLLYFLPVFVFSVYSLELLPNQVRWVSLAAGLAISAFGTTIFFFYGSRWQRELLSRSEPVAEQQPNDEIPESLESQQQIRGYVEEIESKQAVYLTELEQKEAELLKVYDEKRELSTQLHEVRHQLECYLQQQQESLSTKEKSESEYLKTITDQREVIEKQEQHIMKVEDQVRDLTYEVKALRQQNENHRENHADGDDAVYEPEQRLPNPLHQPKPAVPPVIEANLQLKRCIDIAQKITVSSPFGGELSRFRDLPVNSFSLDLRRLFDSLRSENSNTIILYSQKEEKLLFANNQTKNLLDWSPEKFVQDFKELIVEGADEWSSAINQLSSKSEVQIHLTMKSRSGQDLPIQCHLGAIPTGMFKNHLIGVLYQIE